MKKLINRLIIGAIAIAFCFAFCTLASSAAEGHMGGECGGGVTWTLDDGGTLTISGNGAINNGAFYNSEIFDAYNPSNRTKLTIKKIIISDGVTAVGDFAFFGCTEAETAEIGKTVNAVGLYSFSDCTKLKNVIFNGRTDSIDKTSFTSVEATVYFYREDNWSGATMQNYGGKLIWEQQSRHKTHDRDISDLPESRHNYEGKYSETFTVEVDDALSITLDFNKDTSLAEGDKLTVTDSYGRKTVYFGDELSGESITVIGGKIEIAVSAGEAGGGYGFKLDSAIASVLLHEYTIGYQWSEDKEHCTATRTCAEDESEVLTETTDYVSVAKTKEPSCEEEGELTYKAEFQNSCFNTEYDSKAETSRYIKEAITALGHKYGEAEYEWGEDYASCTGKRICIRDNSHIETESAICESEMTKEPTCEETGELLYTAVFSGEGFSKQYKTEAVAETGHSYGEVEYTWSEDFSSCTATRVCKSDETHVETEVAQSEITTKEPKCEEKGEKTYTVTFKNSVFKAQTKNRELSALGHDYGDASYSWSKDFSSCTATRVCKNDETHKEIETANSKAEITKEPACEEKGVRIYTAAFKNNAFAAQTTSEEIDAHGHSYLEPEYEWSEDSSECIGKRICIYGCGYVFSEKAVIKVTKEKKAQIGIPGELELMASFNCKAFYTQTKTIEIPALVLSEVFKDVKATAYYAKAVAWAVNNDIAKGTGSNRFSPNTVCSRGQVVTFLWRAEGCPEPSGTENPFDDVTEKDYYYKAVLWAVEKGITSGTGKGKFSPDEPCTRAQVATFLWRSKGCPEPTSEENTFTDIKPKNFYYKAVLWAVENGITKGTGKNLFSPDAVCTRSQIVTFLFRSI